MPPSCFHSCLSGTFYRSARVRTGPTPVNGLVGTQLELAGVSWQADKSVVLVLSTTCGFCTASAPFYRRLTSVTEASGARSLAVFPQSVSEVERYLASAGIAVDASARRPHSRVSNCSQTALARHSRQRIPAKGVAAATNRASTSATATIPVISLIARLSTIAASLTRHNRATRPQRVLAARTMNRRTLLIIRTPERAASHAAVIPPAVRRTALAGPTRRLAGQVVDGTAIHPC